MRVPSGVLFLLAGGLLWSEQHAVAATRVDYPPTQTSRLGQPITLEEVVSQATSSDPPPPPQP
ncbi:MAG: hypothetical protein ACK40D_13375, partial [Cyanobacteriota bacterium]